MFNIVGEIGKRNPGFGTHLIQVYLKAILILKHEKPDSEATHFINLLLLNFLNTVNDTINVKEAALQ